MVWPFSSSRQKIPNHDKILAHLEIRDRALALALPPPSTASSQELEQSLRHTALVDADFHNGMDISIKPLDRQILGADFAGITGGIQNKQWTAVDVLVAFVRAARRAHLRTNCITEANFDQALVRAAELDKYFQQTGKLVGPLHGVPISIKEHFKMKGVRLSLGFTSWFGKPIPNQSASVILLAEHLGAIPFVKTNIPQTMLAFECRNPVFGTTLNPYSPNHTSGGSSGGEAALLACDGSAAGVGSDIGGSLRIPVGYCGLYSLKPSFKVWPFEGSADFGKGFEGVNVVSGPICRSAQDLETFHTAMIKAIEPPTRSVSITEKGEQDGQDLIAASVAHDQLLSKVGLANLPHTALNEVWFEPLKVVEKRGTPLRVGYYFTDGFIKTTPACYRAMKESLEALQAKYSAEQIQLVPIAPKDLQPVEALELFMGLTSADGYDYLTKPHLGKDRRDPVLMLPLLLARMPLILKRILAFFARYIIRDAKMARLVLSAGRKSAKKYFETTAKRTSYLEAWTQRVWDQYDLDAIICPVQASPALPHGGASKLAMLCVSTALYNILDCSVATLPVTRVNPETDSHRAGDYKQVTDDAKRAIYDAWAQDEDLKKCSRMVNFELYTQGVYDAKRMEGLPVGVQVVTRPYQEEKAIGIMRLLDDALPPMASRGGVWLDQVDHKGAVLAAATGPAQKKRGFGPGSFTQQVFGQATLEA